MNGRWDDAVLVRGDGTVTFGPDCHDDHDSPDLGPQSYPCPPKVCGCGPMLRACCVPAERAAMAAADAARTDITDISGTVEAAGGSA